MGIQRWSEEIILVDLPKGLAMGEDLETVGAMVRTQSSCHVIVDLSRVDIINSTNLAILVDLHNRLRGSWRRLMLCSVAPATRGIFSVTELDSIFEFFPDKTNALTALEATAPSETSVPLAQVTPT